ncbi:unnamed protein product [Onchocerca flexuosa]|uniref:Uncharacterized protein n=1 Tax=Onchocerca flexuosa TaxID=387005 RepID=A0A183H8E7_9BILA|nr:unnamed protein product [Onchocerca flexuosa]
MPIPRRANKKRTERGTDANIESHEQTANVRETKSTRNLAELSDYLRLSCRKVRSLGLGPFSNTQFEFFSINNN